jgi:hypothetical protein
MLADSTAITTYLVFVGVVSALALVLASVVLTLAFRETRRDRIARHESIPAYYGRGYFAH